MRRNSWLWYFFRGYRDGLDGTPYRQAPGPHPPPVPDELLSEVWKGYLAGWRAGIRDWAARTLREVRVNARR